MKRGRDATLNLAGQGSASGVPLHLNLPVVRLDIQEQMIEFDLSINRADTSRTTLGEPVVKRELNTAACKHPHLL